VTPHRLASGWSLRTIAGTMAELAALAGEVGDAWLRVVVDERTRAGLADEVRELLPRAIDIRVSSPRERGRDTERGQSHGRSPHDLFTTYLELRGVDDANVERLFSQLYEEELHGVDA
jgi:exonuclease SbcD